jgi:hypothetical protein
VKSALEALGGFTVNVTGTGTAADPWRITFATPSVKNVPALLANGGNLTAPATAITTINTGGGDDTINVGTDTAVFGNDFGSMNEIKGGVTVNAGTGNNDVLNLDDAGDSSTNTSTLTDQRLSGLSYGDIVYQNLDHLNIWLGTGLQLMTIRSTHAGTETIVTGRDGGGVYNVGGVSGQTQNVQGHLVLRACRFRPIDLDTAAIPRIGPAPSSPDPLTVSEWWTSFIPASTICDVPRAGKDTLYVADTTLPNTIDTAATTLSISTRSAA